MGVIILEITEAQAQDAIRDLHRAVALLDLAAKRSENALERHACLVQTNKLVDLAEAFDDACRGIASPPGWRTG